MKLGEKIAEIINGWGNINAYRRTQIAKDILQAILSDPTIVEIDPDAELPTNPHSKDVHLDAGVYDGLNHRAVEEYKELLANWVKKVE